MGKHKGGVWKKRCLHCGVEMAFKYHCHAQSRKFCSTRCSGLYNNGGVEHWTDAENALLSKEFPVCTSIKRLSRKLQRSVPAIHNQAKRLGLKRSAEALSIEYARGGRKNKGNKRPDFLANMFRGSGKNNPFYGKTHTPEVRAVISAKQKKNSAFLRLNSDPEFQKNRQAAHLHAMKDPVASRARLMKAAATLRNGEPNKAEAKLDRMLQQLFPGEYKYTGNGSFIIDGMNPDWVNVNGQKKVIELFGEHVHDPEQAFCHVPKRQTYRGRKEALAVFGYTSLIIWSRQLRDEKLLTERLKAFHARRCD